MCGIPTVVFSLSTLQVSLVIQTAWSGTIRKFLRALSYYKCCIATTPMVEVCSGDRGGCGILTGRLDISKCISWRPVQVSYTGRSNSGTFTGKSAHLTRGTRSETTRTPMQMNGLWEVLLLRIRSVYPKGAP